MSTADDTLTDGSDAELAAMLRTSITKLARAQRSERQRNRPESLPFALMSVLSILEREGPKTPTELAALEGVRKPSLTRALAPLIEDGYVEREDHPNDRRQFYARITREGRRVIRSTRETVEVWYIAHIGQLSTDDRAALRAAAPALRRLAETITT